MLIPETPKEIQCRQEAENRFSDVGHRFYDGLLNVKNGWGWGCINADGEQVIPCRYSEQILFDSTGYARVKTGRHGYGLIDRAGIEWIPCEYDNTEGFDDDGYARFQKDIYWGTVDMEGRKHILPKMKFQKIGPFTDGVAIAKIETKWGLIDPEGNHLTDFKYYEIDPKVDGLYRVRIKPKLYNFLKPDGSHLFPFDFSYIDEFDENGYAIFFLEPSKKEKTENPKAKMRWGVAHISGIVIYPGIYDSVKRWEDPGETDVYFAAIGAQSYYLWQSGRVININEIVARQKAEEKERFFKMMTEKYPMSKKLVEDILNWTLPGLQFFYRDCQTELDVDKLYEVGDIFRAGSHVDVTPMLYKPVGNVRFLIASAHAAPWFEHPMNVEQSPKILPWRMHKIHRNSYFKVMDIYRVGDVTQVFLLHIPYRGIGLFLGETLMKFMSDGKGTSLVEMARSSFDIKLQMEPHETSLDPDWVKKTEWLVGVDDLDQLCDIGYDRVVRYAPLVDESIHRMSGDNEEINVPEE